MTDMEEIEQLKKSNLLWEELYDRVVKERNQYKENVERLQSYINHLEDAVKYLTNEVAKGV